MARRSFPTPAPGRRLALAERVAQGVAEQLEGVQLRKNRPPVSGRFKDDQKCRNSPAIRGDFRQMRGWGIDKMMTLR